MIQVCHLTKRYRQTIANDDISVEIAPGAISMLVGPNGAGKSTLIKSICGLLRHEGTVTIGGYDNHTPQAKRLLGYVPEFPALYPMLTVAEHLEFIARAYRLDDGWRQRADDLLVGFQMDDKHDKLGRELSKGMQQKLSVCCTLLPGPRAVVLDEPLVGLDPQGIRQLKQVMSRLRADGCALLVSTHIIDTLADDWDVMHIMMAGRFARTIQRGELAEGESLQDAYFAVTEPGVPA